jgi:RHS repeat-associated protein
MRSGKGAQTLVILCGLLVFALVGVFLRAQSATSSQAGNTGTIWIGETGGIVKVSSPEGSVASRISGIKSVRALAIDEVNGRLWALGQGKLYAYGFDGTQFFGVPIDTGELEEIFGRPTLVVDSSKGEVWLGAGKKLYRIDAQGNICLRLTVSPFIQGLAMDSAESRIWIATPGSVYACDEAGNRVKSISLPRLSLVTDIGFDPLTSRLFVALATRIRCYNSAGQLQFDTRLHLVDRIAVDKQGGVWAAGLLKLSWIDASGQILFSVNPFLKIIHGPVIDLAPDPADGSVWVIGLKVLSHVSSEGRVLNVADQTPGSRGRLWSMASQGESALPVIHITAPGEDSFLGAATPAIEVSYSGAGSEIDPSSLTFKANGQIVQTDCTHDSGSAMCTLTDPLPEGRNTLSATIRDSAGRTSQPSEVRFTVDLTAPEVTFVSPADGLVTNQQTQTITGRVSETAELTVNGQPVILNANHEFSHEVTLQTGSNTFSFNAQDRAGNTGEAAIGLTLDNTLPGITITSPVDGLVTNQAGQTITGRLNEAATLTLNGQAVTVNADNQFTTTVTLQPGLNTFLLRAADQAGNTAESTLRLTLDTTAPSITVVSPPDGLITNRAAQTVTGHLSEQADLTINGQAVVLGSNYEFSHSISVASGLNTVILRAIDRAGNISQASITVFLDTVHPVVTVISPEAGLITNQPVQTITGAVSEPVSLTLNGEAVGVGPDGSFSPSVTLAEGVNTFVFSALDRAGNTGSTTLSMALDSILPEIAVTSPADGLLTNRPVHLVEGHVSESVQLSLNGEAVDLDGEGGFSFEFTFDEGLNVLTFSALDQAGNTSELTLNVTLDTTPPPAPNKEFITVSQVTEGQVSLTGADGSVEPETLVMLINVRTSESASTTASSSGSFSLRIEAQAGDRLLVRATDSLGNTGGESSLNVPYPPSPAADNIPEGTFGEMYRDLVPHDATITEYTPNRFSLVTGLVLDASGNPLSDVFISILGHPEYGSTATGSDGRFGIPVEGGSRLSVEYRKEGFISAQRQVNVPWNDIAGAETLVMVALDPASTTMTFDGNSETVVTHRSTPVSDASGTRSCSVVFKGDNRVFTVDDAGNVTGELTTITTRATEFPTPEAMPAKLPPTSAFTYCVELGVDGAERVKFEKPVAVWVENFLGFGVGEIVPAGYYDRSKGAWVAAPNGRVVRLLDRSGDGVVDALDANGDGQPDDLNANGSTGDEVAGLGDSSIYPAGATFWRVEVTHFTPWDFNWPWMFPWDAIAPNPNGDVDADLQMEEQKSCPLQLNSFVEERSRIFHEDIPVPGTNLTLHYASNRVRGYRQSISVPISGATVPASLNRILVQLDVAGRHMEYTLSPLPNQKVDFAWDGLDYMGRRIDGSISAHVKIGFVYNGVYATAPSQFAQSFGQAGASLTSVQARQEVISWREQTIPLPKGKGTLAEGWSLSNHHYLSLGDLSTLHKGDGSLVAQNAQIINTIAGAPGAGFSGDGGPATQAQLNYPQGMVFDAAGNLFIADYINNRVRKIDPSGIITTVAGTGAAGFSGDGGAAVQAALSNPIALAVDSFGNLFISDYENFRIRKVDRNGIITTVAGNGAQGYSGDNGPATQARIDHANGIEVDASGSLFIADTHSNRVRRVDPSGIITTVAGTGTAGYSGNGGRATAAAINQPVGVAFDGSANMYIVEFGSHAVRKVSPAGIISAVAGTGSAGYSGDGGPATQAKLYYPFGVEADGEGNLIIFDTYNCRVRRVDRNGIITTITGNSTYGYSGDGGPAGQAQIGYIQGGAIDPVGNVHLADIYYHRIRKIALSPAFASSVASGETAFFDKNGLGYVLSSAGKHVGTVDLSTGVALTTFGYNDEKELVSITDALGNEVVIERGAFGTPTAIVSPDGLRTALSVDSEGRLTGITHPDSGHYAFEYEPGDLLSAKVEPRGNRFEQVYDASGRISDVKDGEGGHWRFERTAYANSDVLIENVSAEGNRVSYLDHTDSTGGYRSTITDASGAQTLFSESADGMSAAKDLSCGLSSAFQYGIDPWYKSTYLKQATEKTPSNLQRVTLIGKTYQDSDGNSTADRITQTVSLNGKVSSLLTDTLQGQRVFTSPAGRTATSLYNRENLLTTRLSRPGLFDTSFEYDSKGRVSAVKTSERETGFTYDSQGNVASITDPENRTTTFSYDPAGRMSGIHRFDGTSLGFEYDPNGNMSVLATPTGVEHGFDSTGVNTPSSYTTPLSGSYTYSYDRDRLLTSILLPSGKEIRNIHDKGRLVREETQEGSTEWSYLCSSKIGTVTRGTETITYGYDGPLVTSETLSGTLNQSLTFGYNADFNLSRIAYAGASFDLGYDADGLLTRSGAYTIARSAQTGLPTSLTGGSLALSRSFSGYAEKDGEAYRVNGADLYSWTLGREKTGRITSKTETAGAESVNYTYGYDALGRLLTVRENSTLIEEYRYDANGNRIFEMNLQRGIGSKISSYSQEDHLLTSGDATYEFDADGFLQRKTEGSALTEYTYSSKGELMEVRLPGGTLIEYDYDPLGRRIAKKVEGVVREKYLWLGRTRLLAVFDGEDNLSARFEYGDGRMPVAMVRGGTTYYLSYDQVGSLRFVVNGTGAVVKEITYDSFGNILTETNPSFSVPFGFAGGYLDNDTGLVRFGFRDYDPLIGRWAAKDPILFQGGDANLYGYVQNDPVNAVDPLGLAKCQYSISSHTLVCRPNDPGFIGPPISLGPDGVFSGMGECRNSPPCSDDKNKGPIPPGNYNMNPDNRPGHESFWRLEPNPRIPGWKYYLGLARSGFELHPGSVSLGCITTDKNNPFAMDQYGQVHNLLQSESGSNALEVVP